MSRYHALRVRAVVDETHDTKSLVFEVPPALASAFAYQPGQFLTLRLPIDGRHVPRCYSMSSAPGVDDAPRVTIKRVQGGRGSNWVCDTVRAGHTLEVMAPAACTPQAATIHSYTLGAHRATRSPACTFRAIRLRATCSLRCSKSA